jgi:hypothetical protein
VQTANSSIHLQPPQPSNPTTVHDDKYFDDDLDDEELMNIPIAAEDEYFTDNETTFDVNLEEIEIQFGKKPKLLEYEIEDCRSFSGVRWVKGFILSHSKLICRNGFQLQAVLSNERGAEMNVILENSVCIFLSSFWRTD